MMGLLARADLEPQVVERLAATADEAIASTAEREAVLARARAWEAPSPTPEPEAAAEIKVRASATLDSRPRRSPPPKVPGPSSGPAVGPR